MSPYGSGTDGGNSGLRGGEEVISCQLVRAAKLPALVALGADWLNVKPVTALIAKVMVVLPRPVAAVRASQHIGTGHPPSRDGMVHGVPRFDLIADLERELSGRNPRPSADHAARIEPVVAAGIGSEVLGKLPVPAAPTEFPALGKTPQILFRRHAAAFGGSLRSAFFISGHEIECTRGLPAKEGWNGQHDNRMDG